jgi:DNA-binding response OmpR family regulator
MTWPMYLRHECLIEGELIQFTKSEAEVVATLLLNRGKAFSADELIESLYPDPDAEPDSAKRAVHVFIYRVLRKAPMLIESLGWCQSHMGYIIRRPEQLVAWLEAA